MARYLILGAGKFGRLALERLGGQDELAAFLVVDRSPPALPGTRGLITASVEWVEAEASSTRPWEDFSGTPLFLLT